MKEQDLVYVVWQDSMAISETPWARTEALHGFVDEYKKDSSTNHITTVGFVFSFDDEYLTIISSFQHNQCCVSGNITIPWSCVKVIYILEYIK